MKKTVLVAVYFSIILLIFFVIHLFASFLPEFEEYRCEKGGFSVLLPGKPRETMEDYGLFFSRFNVTKVCSETRDWTFMVMCIEPNEAYHSPSWARQPQEPSLEMMQMMAEVMTRGRLVSEKDVTCYGRPAKDFEFEILRRRKANVRAIAIDKRFYQLVVVGNSQKTLAKVPEFFDSFKIDGVQ